MNILLISPEFHGYQNEFINELNLKGHNVVFISLTFKLNFFQKVLNKLSKKYIQNKFCHYLKNEIQKNKELNFERIVLIYGGYSFTPKNFNFLKTTFKNAKFIYYNWDSVKNNPGSLDYYSLFDDYFSFDLIDCKEYGYMRLDNWFTKCNKINEKPNYDCGILMTFCKSKIEGYLKIKNALPSTINLKEYLVMPNRTHIIREIIFDHKRFRKIDSSKIYKNPLSLNESISFYNDCQAVIDVPLDGQNGLTTRTFEVLKQEKKLITTNQIIKEYEFYTPNNIFIVDDEHAKVPKEFFETPFDKNYSISDKYSLKSFVQKLFCLNYGDYEGGDEK